MYVVSFCKLSTCVCTYALNNGKARCVHVGKVTHYAWSWQIIGGYFFDRARYVKVAVQSTGMRTETYIIGNEYIISIAITRIMNKIDSRLISRNVYCIPSFLSVNPTKLYYNQQY